jgi:hypothetical protein
VDKPLLAIIFEKDLLHDCFGADTSVLEPEEEAPPPFHFLTIGKEYF